MLTISWPAGHIFPAGHERVNLRDAITTSRFVCRELYCRPRVPSGTKNFRRYGTVTHKFWTSQTIVCLRLETFWLKGGGARTGSVTSTFTTSEPVEFLTGWPFLSRKCSPVTITAMNIIRQKKNIQNAVWPISLAERRRAMNASIGCHSYLRADKNTISSSFFKYSQHKPNTNCGTMK
jgi:hypothetical protein